MRIRPAFWASFDANRAISDDVIRSSRRSDVDLGRPVFLTKDLDVQLPTFLQREKRLEQEEQEAELRRSAEGPEDVRTNDKGGAKKKYDDVGFLIEAFRLIYEGKPASQADLIKRALYAYQERGLKGIPSHEWPKKMVRRLWVELGLERTATPTKRDRY